MTSTAAGHTPFHFGNTGPDQIMILDAGDNYVCHIQVTQTGGGMIAQAMEPKRRAYAAFIVRACNSHEALVEAARLGVEYDDLLRRYSGPLKTLCAGDEAAIDAAYDRWINAARAALSLANGEKGK